MKNSPTNEAYLPLQEAYDFFNARLFNNELPLCLMTLQRKNKKVLGFVSRGNFARQTSATRTDELAMNPSFLLTRSAIDVLSTIVHEQTHIWQFHVGKPGRRGYHNKEWGTKMKEVGLYPSSTGEPGGKETGEKMTHFIVADGPFQVRANELIARGFTLQWGEAPPETNDNNEDEPGGAVAKKKTDSSNRIRFKCPTCTAKAWGKPSLKIMCGKCRMDMKPA